MERNAMCPRISYPFYTVTYCIDWIATSWTYNSVCPRSNDPLDGEEFR